MEELGKPAVVVVTAEFEKLALQLAAHRGHAALRVLVLPYPLEGREDAELVEIAERSYPELLDRIGARA